MLGFAPLTAGPLSALAAAATAPGSGVGAAAVWAYRLSNGLTAEQTIVAIYNALVPGPVRADVVRVNGIEITGTGVPPDYWRPQ
jgi:hypothetical protein